MSSERVITCVGGGPSLKGFDFSKLKGYTIGANKAAVIANTSAMVSIDTNFINKGKDLYGDYKGEIYFASPTVKEKPEGVIYWHRDRSTTFSKKEGTLCGLDSGFAALNLAAIKGATHIHLLGYDMLGESVDRFHDGYKWNGGGLRVSYNQWARKYKDAKSVLDSMGITVTHWVGPKGSGIDAFPQKPLEDFQC